MVEIRDKLVLGTAALGMDYGLPGADGRRHGCDEDEARALLGAVRASGFKAVDTAPAYGTAEERLGRWLDPAVAVWTKLAPGCVPGPALDEAVADSLAGSLARLDRERLDLLQWHNWTAALADDRGFRRAWDALGGDPRVRELGCSTYGIEDARAAVESGFFAVVQVEWNLLRQEVVDEVGPAAVARGVRIAARSVLLQGVLADPSHPLPDGLGGLTSIRERAAAAATDCGCALYDLAVGAALHHPHLAHVLVGLRSTAERERLMRVAGVPWDENRHAAALACARPGEPLTDPRNWSLGSG